MIFVLGTSQAPEQFTPRTRDDVRDRDIRRVNVLARCARSTESTLADGCGTAAEYGDARTRPIVHVGSVGVGCLPT